MRLLGVTGDIACGKSTVAKMLAAKGAIVLDSDLLVRELYDDRAFAARVAGLFSQPVLNAQGGVDRAALGKLVFSNPQGMRELEQLVHPAVADLRAAKLAALKESQVAVVEAVKLLESGQGRECDEIWCVVCAPEMQIARLMNNRGLSREEAVARVAAQPSRTAKKELAGSVPLVWVQNDGTMEELKARVDQYWSHFLASGAEAPRNGIRTGL